MNSKLLFAFQHFLIVVTVFFAASSVLAQEAGIETETFVQTPAEDRSSFAAPPTFGSPETPVIQADKTLKAVVSRAEDAKPEEVESEEIKPAETNFIQPAQSERFHWKPALIESGIMLGVQHSFRLLQRRTRKELDGAFFADWAQSAKSLRGWQDGDSRFINYVAHPLQGSTTGRIFVNNSDRAKKQEFGKSKQYWESRLKALAWSAVWSTQFELGPISEATIGNVGLRPTDRHKMAWADLIVTPVGGTAVLVGEDAIDKYVLKKWLERRTNGKVTVKIKILRSLLTPTTSVANLLRRKAPWQRDDRFN